MAIDAYADAARAGIRDCLVGSPYAPGVEPVPANADTLDGYQAGWHVAERLTREHRTCLKRDGGHGYPYRAHCSCGWVSRTYVTPAAAEMMRIDHLSGMAAEVI